MKIRFKLTAKACPVCGETSRYRTARSRKWRLLVATQSYSCRRCHSQYVRLFGFVSLLMEHGVLRSPEFASKSHQSQKTRS